ncbi:Crp/Fnr family transcriptional regulator [Flavobacterium sp.]|uniref:Crp/Fnr family transcriptional regulator n=1 Tax=Flavobacterium sp. TaxID=239 RepID=UPI0026246E33|nr:Crp/Fnr family transcriptional regulator [Flavobacterium sp.]
MLAILQEHYASIFEPKLMDEIVHCSQLRNFNEGDVLIDFGAQIKKMPLLFSGAIKILREDFDEGELLLYFIEKGDTCAMSMACCMGDAKSEIRAVAETNGQVIMIPVSNMEEWLGKYKSWRNYVFNSYNNRLKEMLTAIDSLAFMNMNERLLNYLFEKAKINKSNEVHTTHQQIADDLHTSRVVVSRLLKALENEKRIRLHRAFVEIVVA